VTIAKGYKWQAATIREKSDLAPALEEMINSEGPYLLNVQVPYVEHVLPMIPGGKTVDDIILE
jgi:acetolactate synthase-1/2/3 large subunit